MNQADYHAQVQRGIDKITTAISRASFQDPQLARELGDLAQGIVDCMGAMEQQIVALEERISQLERTRVDMAELPTPEDAARTLLAVCREMGLRPTNPIPAQPLWHQTVGSRRLTQEEFDNGVDQCMERGWFERTENGRDVLTEAGFSETEA